VPPPGNGRFQVRVGTKPSVDLFYAQQVLPSLKFISSVTLTKEAQPLPGGGRSKPKWGSLFSFGYSYTFMQQAMGVQSMVKGVLTGLRMISLNYAQTIGGMPLLLTLCGQVNYLTGVYRFGFGFQFNLDMKRVIDEMSNPENQPMQEPALNYQ